MHTPRRHRLRHLPDSDANVCSAVVQMTLMLLQSVHATWMWRGGSDRSLSGSILGVEAYSITHTVFQAYTDPLSPAARSMFQMQVLQSYPPCIAVV
jgi:hypothetical protein